MDSNQADELLREMNRDVGLGQPLQFAIAFRPMLNGPSSLMSGFRAFHEQESQYTFHSLRAQRSGFEVWYRLLTLGNELVRREHSFEVETELLPSAHLRLKLTTPKH
jgi:hypothetical protein